MCLIVTGFNKFIDPHFVVHIVCSLCDISVLIDDDNNGGVSIQWEIINLSDLTIFFVFMVRNCPNFIVFILSFFGTIQEPRFYG